MAYVGTVTDRPDDAAAAASDRTARLFAALWLPPTVAGQLSSHLDICWSGLVGDRKSSAVASRDDGAPAPQLRRTRADTWHVTLAFLGEAPLTRSIGRFLTPSRGIPDAQALPAPGPLQLSGAGSFGPAIWVGIAHDGWLTKLAGVMQQRLAVRDRRFQAHVTIGRVRGKPAQPGQGAPGMRGSAKPAINPVISGAVSALGEWRGPSWTPTEVVLVESVLGPIPRYPIEARLPLV